MAQLNEQQSTMSATKALKERFQQPDDSGVLMSRVATSRENASERSADNHVCYGKPSVTGAPFVCNSCGAIKNCNSFQDEGEQFNSDVEGSSKEFLQKIFSASNIAIDESAKEESAKEESAKQRNLFAGMLNKISSVVLDLYKGSTASVVSKNQPEEVKNIKVELAEVKDQLASLENKTSKQEWVIDSLHCEIAELKNTNKSQLKEMATEIQIIKDLYMKKTLDKTTTTNLEEESTSSKLKEDSKVPQMESDVQLPVDEVNAKVLTLPTDDENSESSASSDISLGDKIQNEKIQSVNPVQVSASDIQTSASDTTSLLLDNNSSTALQTSTPSWLAARLISRVLAVVKSGFSFGIRPELSVDSDQGSELEQEHNPKGTEGSCPKSRIPRTDNISDLAVSSNGSVDQLQDQPEFQTQIVTRQKDLRLALRDVKQVRARNESMAIEPERIEASQEEDTVSKSEADEDTASTWYDRSVYSTPSASNHDMTTIIETPCQESSGPTNTNQDPQSFNVTPSSSNESFLSAHSTNLSFETENARLDAQPSISMPMAAESSSGTYYIPSSQRRWISRDICVDISTLDEEQKKRLEGLASWVERGHEENRRRHFLARWVPFL